MKNSARVLLFLILSCSPAGAQLQTWRHIDDGLSIAEILSPVKSSVGDSRITVVRVDPKYYAFRLLCADRDGGQRMTANEWSRKYKLGVVINAGMFRSDGLTSTGFMKDGEYVNNPTLTNYNSVLTFNPLLSGVREVQVADLRCDDFKQLQKQYSTIIQNIRMITCQRRNTWSKQPKKWSMVALGTNDAGNIMFIFTRSPYAVHDFINILLALPISLRTTMYLEGGPEASLYLSVGGLEMEKFGSFETGFNENDGNDHAWEIPNVIGIVKKVKN